MYKTVRQLYILALSMILGFNLQAQELPPQPQAPTYEVKIEPSRTYLFVDTMYDVVASASSFDLNQMYQDVNYPLKEGDLISFEVAGFFKPGESFPDAYTSLGAVFVGASDKDFLSAGPRTTAWVFESMPTYQRSIATNIPQDFSIPYGSLVYAQVPVGAKRILFTVNDSFFADNADPNSDFKITIKIRVIKTDVTVGSIQIPDAQINVTDNLPILSTDGWYEVKVDVSMVGALDILNTYVSIPVVLTLGNVIQTAWIPAHELSQENSRQISIWINPNWNYLGLQDLKISVNPDKSFEENNFENNQVVQQVYVVGKYKIEKKILYSTDNGATFNPHPNPDFFQMRPTVDTRNTHCKSVYTYSRVRIVLECQKDDGTDEKVDGCEVMITKKLGNHFGGHLFHNNEDRTLGSFVRNQMPYNIDEEYKTIPKDGLIFAYEAARPIR